MGELETDLMRPERTYPFGGTIDERHVLSGAPALDVDALNTQAKILYDHAHKRGFAQGEEKGLTDAGVRAADTLLRTVVALCREIVDMGAHGEHRAALPVLRVAQRVLGGTPGYVSRPTGLAIEALKRAVLRRDRIDYEVVLQAGRHAYEARERLRETYPWLGEL